LKIVKTVMMMIVILQITVGIKLLLDDINSITVPLNIIIFLFYF